MPKPLFVKLKLEALEPRLVMASVMWAEGLVTILGTPDDDSLVFRLDGAEYVVDGTSARIPVDQAQRLDVQLLAGDDYFRNDSDLPSTITGGAGNDILIGGSANDQIFGESGDDVLDSGGGLSDFLQGGEGNDRLDGATQVDQLKLNAYGLVLYATSADDSLILRGDETQVFLFGMSKTWQTQGFLEIHGGAGNDRILNLTARPVMMHGEEGSDVLWSSIQNDLLDGGVGDDLLFGGQGNDTLLGGSNNDRLAGGSGDDYYVFDDAIGEERDVIHDAGGLDTLSFDQSNQSVALAFDGERGQALQAGRTLRVPAAAVEFIRGSNQNDTLQSSSSTRQMDGLAGDDTLIGADGPQILVGGEGNDTLRGMDGDDELDGGSGNDYLDGGKGDDSYIFASAPKKTEYDALQDIAGENTLDFRLNGYSLLIDLRATSTIARDQNRIVYKVPSNTEGVFKTIYGGTRSDTIYATGTWGTRIYAGNGYNQVYGSQGDDYIEGGKEYDKLYGGEGNDIILGGQAGDDIYGGGGNDILVGDYGNDHIYGEDGDDIIVGNGNSDTLYGGAGHDEIWGGNRPNDAIVLPATIGDDAADVMFGDAGDDFLFGDKGDDQLTGGEGNDTLDGDIGNNTFIFGTSITANETDIIRDVVGNNTLDFRTNTLGLRIDTGAPTILTTDGRRTIERTVQATHGNFTTIFGGSGDDEIIIGGTADVVVQAGEGDNIVIGGAGDLYATGGSGRDTLIGGSGNDRLYGREGNDWLVGGKGDDLLIGSGGADHLEGGDGIDVLFGDDPLPGDCHVATIPYQITTNGQPDVLLGGLGDDYLNGGEGDDTLYGEEGYDRLIGGAGIDLLYPADDLVKDDELTKFG